ncbi:MAG: prolyl oligopeptidase family serine peptidase [Candidatus Nealsonbacteria bacterium]|nr:prolyl oligopeptidase family serine peptidase [Candidatus Nealsonbacteria bacterium]
MPALVVRVRAVLFAILILSTAAALGQGTRADYERADKLRELTRNKVFDTKVEPHWFADGNRFWYRNNLADDAREFVLVDATASTRRPAFDHAKLAESLSKATGGQHKPTHLPIEKLEFDDSAATMLFSAAGKRFQCDLKSCALTVIEPPKPPEKKEETEKKDAEQKEDKKEDQQPSSADEKTERHEKKRPQTGQKSPDGKWTTCIKDHNVYLQATEGGEEFQLSDDGNEDYAYRQILWSPDSKKLVVMRQKKADQRTVYLIESSPKDQLQPKLHSHNYLKPGDQVSFSKPHLFDVAARKQIPVDDKLFANPWSINALRWCPTSRRFTFFFNQRGHQAVRIIAVDAQSGEAGAIVNEQSKTFVDYAGKLYTNYLDESHEIIWMSERDGYNHLYLIDSRSGDVKNQITKGSWVVRRVDRVDNDKRQIWFQAGGIYPEQDPYYIHYCRVNFDGTGLLVLTDGNGTHSIDYSPDRRFIIDTYSRVDMPRVTELRRVADGKLVCELERSDMAPLTATGWQVPERFVSKGRDGETDIYGVIFRPTNFDPAKKYPVIEQIYAGPHGSHVPKRFESCHGAQIMAELGFIVVQIDGMGTSNRSKAFHDVCWKNLGDSGFPDRILWINAATKKYPYMDVTRVGIYGGSAGGQSSTRAVLAHGEFYKVAVSDCGCHDNRMDKIWWNELWMSWPVGPHYEEQSNVTCAHQLTGKLLLIVGELDRNVDPASTMQVVDALIKADKDFDMLVVPGSGHGSAGTSYGRRRQRDYFVRHLLGVEPRAE